jgi:hypothetical protein
MKARTSRIIEQIMTRCLCVTRVDIRLRGAAVESILDQPVIEFLFAPPETDSLVTSASSLLPEGVQPWF